MREIFWKAQNLEIESFPFRIFEICALYFECMSVFSLHSPWQPSGDQPQAIDGLLSGLKEGIRRQTLLGVTGSGKTFTMANVIHAHGKPTLVLAHNKTLAAQLAQEYQAFFPKNAVHYFVSYYDYYQPEAYLSITDTYIEKDAQINAEIDRLRHASTASLLTRKDVIIVASVSAIYGLGSPEEYAKEHLLLSVGDECSRTELLHRLVSIHFTRTNADLSPAQFRAIGNRIEVMPVSEKQVYLFELFGEKLSAITLIDPVTQKILDAPKSCFRRSISSWTRRSRKQQSGISVLNLKRNSKNLKKRRNRSKPNGSSGGRTMILR
jgi:excinuclease ABC subunit B